MASITQRVGGGPLRLAAAKPAGVLLPARRIQSLQRPSRTVVAPVAKVEAPASAPAATQAPPQPPTPPAAPPLPRSEEARKYFRTVYDFPNWKKHRASDRLLDRLFKISNSHILQNVVPTATGVMAIAAFVVAYHYLFDNGYMPAEWPNLNPSNQAQAFVQNTSVALSLLLVFRTNSSYGRWDEARKMWGGLLNRSRDIMRQGATFFPDDAVESKKALARWTIAFSRALRIHFQPEVTLEAELKDILTPAELKMLGGAQHKPVRAIHAISQIIQSVPMSTYAQQTMSQNLTFFHDVLGGCERLLRAPIPVSYTRHTARFLSVWLMLLPFSLYDKCGWGVIPVCGGITFVLCGIEEIGVQAEEPFGILPLDVICNRIQADVTATLKDDEDTKAILANIWQADLAAAEAEAGMSMQSEQQQLVAAATVSALTQEQAEELAEFKSVIDAMQHQQPEPVSAAASASAASAVQDQPVATTSATAPAAEPHPHQEQGLLSRLLHLDDEKVTEGAFAEHEDDDEAPEASSVNILKPGSATGGVTSMPSSTVWAAAPVRVAPSGLNFHSKKEVRVWPPPINSDQQ